MSDKGSNQAFLTEAKFSFSSFFKLGGKMSENGADKAGNKVASGIRIFLVLLGLAALSYVFVPEGLIKPLELQQSDSPASSHTSSKKLPTSHSD